MSNVVYEWLFTDVHKSVKQPCLKLTLVVFRVQEIMGEDQKEAGRIPRTVDCELTHDLGNYVEM